MAEFFEGREKLLEIWFKPPVNDHEDSPSVSPGATKHIAIGKVGLRTISRERWQELLKVVKCTILSELHNDFLDSYVLSESSLFVAPYRVILKTCGTTTLLPAVPKLLAMAHDLGLTEVQELFFSRHEYMQPEQQAFPHSSFRDEVRFLDEIFHGAAYLLGRVNGDMWYLYTLDKPNPLPRGDSTLELMMSDLDEEAMKAFYKGKMSAQEVTKATGIADLIPKSDIHDFLFEPCGYSCNALFEDMYFTIHVTPQKEFSYASFETDVTMKDYGPLINQVLEIFKPRYFALNVFCNYSAECGRAENAFEDADVKGFVRRDRQLYEFQQYTLNFGHFVSTSSDSGVSSSHGEPIGAINDGVVAAAAAKIQAHTSQ